jgi:hypothetical protein
MRKTFRVKLNNTVSDYNRDYAIANLSHRFSGYDPQFTDSKKGFMTFSVDTDEHLTNDKIKNKLMFSSFVASVSSGDPKKRVIKVPQFKEAYTDFAHGTGVDGNSLVDTASNNPFTIEIGKSGVSSDLGVPETQNPQYLIGQSEITDPQRNRRLTSWIIGKKEKDKEVDEDGLLEDEVPQGRKLTDLWGGIGGLGASNDVSGGS